MKIKVKILIAVLVFIIINYIYEVYFNNTKSINIPVSYPSQYDYKIEVNKFIKSNKKDMTVLFFTSKSCIPCMKMKQLVWSDETVQKSVGKYNNSPQMLDSSNQNDIEEFYRYNIQYVPTTIVTDKKGEALKRSVGYMSIEELLNFLH